MICAGRIRLGWAHDVVTFVCHMFMHFSCIRTNFVSILLILNCVWCFFACLSLSLFLFLSVSCFMAPKRKFILSRTLFVPRHLLLLPLLILLHPMSDSMMIKPVRTFWRTFHDAAFIWYAKSFYRIVLILTFPLLSTVGVRSHYVASWSLVPPWSYRSFTPTYIDLILQYLILSLTFEVRTL